MWIAVKDWKELPQGHWLVQLETPSWGCPFAVASIRPNSSIIGGLFAFDQKRVVAYMPLPEPMSTGPGDLNG